MTALVIKNLPETLHRDLKARAVRNHRSVTKEAIALLEAGVNAPAQPLTSAAELMDALAAAGEGLKAKGVDFEAWAAHSREVWR